MSSAAKAFANRANAAHSTGPADTSRTRFNGLAHGLTSKQLVIPGESQADYETFAAAIRRDLRPGSAIENVLADRIVAAAWRLQRFTRIEGAFFNSRIDAFCKENPEADPDFALANLFTDPAETARMRLFLRYQTAVQREYDKAVSEFRKAQQDNRENSLERAYSDSIGFASQPSVATESGKATEPGKQPAGFTQSTDPETLTRKDIVSPKLAAHAAC